MDSGRKQSLDSSGSVYDSPCLEYGDLGVQSDGSGSGEHMALVVDKGRNWNEEYQTILDLSFESEEEEMSRLFQLRQLSTEFAARASEIGQVIITEKALSYDLKSIKPSTQQLGGYAGGEKFLAEGIFFKFAVDNNGLYGDDENAMKCGGHEFKSFMELADCRVQGLHFPLLVIVDFRGFRLLAQSILPIGSNTLIYGSSDGGKQVYAKDSDMNRRMKRAAKMLNLAGHSVQNTAKTDTVRLHGPVDCEGHLGLDGRFYVIDPARLFPPAKPKPSIKGGKLFLLLRPELVMKSRFPLCSDAFSNFQIEDRTAHDDKVILVDTYLHSELIPEFAQFLCHDYHNKYNQNTNQHAFDSASSLADANGAGTIYSSRNIPFTPATASLYHVLTTQHLDLTDLERIINEAHRKGINLRYFGEVRQLVPNSAARPHDTTSPHSNSPSATDATSSQNKSNSESQSKTSGAKSSKPHRRSTSQDEEVGPFNPAQGSLGLDLLRQVLLTIIVGRALKNLIRSHLRTIHTPDERPYRKLLLTYLNLLFGRTPKAVEFWSRPIKNSIEKYFPSALSAQELDPSYNLRNSILPYTLYLYLQDLLGLEMRVECKAKFTNVDPNATSQSELGPSQYLLFKALVDSDLVSMFPKVRYTNRMSFEEGTALSKKAKFASSQEASDRYFHLAEKNYRSALRIKPDDYRALHNWGLSLSLQAQTKTGPEAASLFALAQSKWSQALDINPQDYRAYLLWGNMLLERAEAIPTALPHHMDGSGKNKLLATREAEKLALLEDACSRYARAYELNEEQYETLYNWATSLLIRGTLDSEHALELLQEAANKYQGATAIKDYSLKAHLNWAVAIAKCARATFDRAFPPNSHLQEASGQRSKRRSTELFLSRMAITSSSGTTNASETAPQSPLASQSPVRLPPVATLQSLSSVSSSSQLSPSTTSKAFKKAEKLFSISTEKFEECVELRPDDCEVYFNFGNMLYRRARMHERCKSYSSAIELCSLCCERYISAINIKLNYYDALYNWGSVVHFLTTLPQPSDHQSDSKEIQILFIVNCYLEVFKKVALKYGGTERFKLDPVLSLLHSRRETIQRRAIHVINALSNDGKDAIQREAYRAIKSLLSNPVTRRMMNEELEEGDWSKYASNIVRSIGIANKWVDDEDEGGKVTLDSFAIGSVIDGGDAGVGKMMRTVRKTTQQPFVMIVVAHNELLDRLGILEKEGALSSMNQEQAFALRKSFISHLKTERTFLAQLQYSFQTEEDDYCLMYRYAYNPGMLWEFLSNPVTPPKMRESQIRFYAAEILLALQSLHSREMMYGDLNPLELVVDHAGHIILHKIPFSQNALIKPSDLSPEYVSPEVLTSQQPYKSTTDWYCFGVLLYQLATCVVQSFATEEIAASSASSSSSKTATHSGTSHAHTESYLSSNTGTNALSKSQSRRSGKHSRASSSDAKGSSTESTSVPRMIQIPALSWVDDSQDVNFDASSTISADLKDLISKLVHIDPKSRLQSATKIQKHPFWSNMNWKVLDSAGIEPPFRPGLGPSSGLTNTFTAVPTLLAKLKRGKFHGYSFVEP